jgi:hypothetical protein
MSARPPRCPSAPAWLRSGAIFILIVCLAPSVQSQQPPAVAESIPDQRIVVRLSDAMLNSLMTKGFARQTEVREVILGTAIYGRAYIQAQPGVALKQCPDQATFQLVVEGTAHSRSTGHNGPAIIYSRSVTTFRATKQVIFDPGKGFYALAPRVQASTQTFIDGIGSQRGGIVGRIVRRRATREAAARHDLATEIARQKAARRIAILFDRHTEQRLARLNRIAELRGVAIAALRPAGSGEPKYVCCTTPTYLQIATNFSEAETNIALPTGGPASASAAPIEVWVHKSLVSERLQAAIQLMNARSKASDLFTTITRTARILETSALNGAGGRLLALWPVKMRQVGDWHVVEVDATFENGDALAATQPELRR